MARKSLDLAFAAATVAAMENPASSSAIALECYYAYGYRGRAMMAVRAPFAMSGDAPELVGQTVSIGGAPYRVVGVWRQISGPIAKGEPIGVEVSVAASARRPEA
mgnify:FL=1